MTVRATGPVGRSCRSCCFAAFCLSLRFLCLIIMRIINLNYIVQFDINGILTALYIVMEYIQTQYMHVWTYLKHSYSYIYTGLHIQTYTNTCPNIDRHINKTAQISTAPWPSGKMTTSRAADLGSIPACVVDVFAGGVTLVASQWVLQWLLRRGCFCWWSHISGFTVGTPVAAASWMFWQVGSHQWLHSGYSSGCCVMDFCRWSHISGFTVGTTVAAASWLFLQVESHQWLHSAYSSG